MTTDSVADLDGIRVLICTPDGATLRTEADATDLIGQALSQDVEWILVPVERLDPSFFSLSSGLAGAVVQKVVNYRLRLVVIGDISEHLGRSKPLRDYVGETNRGRQTWFLPTVEEFTARLNAAAR